MLKYDILNTRRYLFGIVVGIVVAVVIQNAFRLEMYQNNIFFIF
jgi:hypothetical protein